MQTHENLRRDETLKTSSDRFFGLLFFFVFLLIALWPLLKGKPVYLVPLGIALAFLAISLIVPRWLAPLNRLWMKFGELLHRIVSPVILGIMFFGVITPVGLLMRLAGKDLLRTKFDRDAPSYWIRREPPGPEKSSLKRQF
ncbi:MAG: hypothetical protein B7X93_10905 [Hydrogenophilales bacterium 17-61-9]|nr:MAG: hypothetical protein B7X93_10905 [Hydrogenophilales bacterium 17-61-9]